MSLQGIEGAGLGAEVGGAEAPGDRLVPPPQPQHMVSTVKSISSKMALQSSGVVRYQLQSYSSSSSAPKDVSLHSDNGAVGWLVGGKAGAAVGLAVAITDGLVVVITYDVPPPHAQHIVSSVKSPSSTCNAQSASFTS